MLEIWIEQRRLGMGFFVCGRLHVLIEMKEGGVTIRKLQGGTLLGALRVK